MRRIIFLLALTAGLASALAVRAADAATLQVAASAPDVLASDGTCSLREAIINANHDAATWPDCPAGSGADTIVLPAGTYVLAIPGTDEDAAATGDLDVLDDLTLVGAGPALTTIDAAGLDRVFQVLGYGIPGDEDVSIDGLTITGGVTTGPGGGIRVDSASLSLRNTTVSGNSAGLGGGLSIISGSLQAKSVIISENNAGQGGGAFFFMDLSASMESIIESSAIVGNQAAGQGGGLHLFGGSAGIVTLVDTSVFENVAAEGGGIFAAGATTVDAQTSAVFANTAARGAGVMLRGAPGGRPRPTVYAVLSATNSSVSENLGEGIHMFVGKSELRYATVAGNTGGGVISDPVYGDESYLYLAKSIVANQDLEADCLGDGLWVYSEGHNLDSDGTCNLTDPTDLPNTDPILGVLQDNGGPTLTHALLPGSPAIGAVPLADCTYDDGGDPGTPEVPLAEDQRGVARPQRDGCDIGAYEVTACADGIDNDDDAFIDAADPGCQDAASIREDPQCQDGINNDPGQDDLIDFDGGLSALGYVATDPDPQCVGKPWKNKERRDCGLGVELALFLPLLIWFRGRRGSGRMP